MTRKFAFIAVLWMHALLGVATAVSPAQAQDTTQASDPHLQMLRTMLEKPEDQIDLARAKLTIDRMIDPSIDIESNLRKLDALAEQVNALIPFNTFNVPNRKRLEALIRYLYVAGSWNGNQPFRYDLDDPFGSNIRNKLLPTYLATKRGNCVSMPFLFVVLGQKLGIDVAVSTTPEHVFVKYRGEDGNYYNFEATSGGPKQDLGYQRDTPMTKQALANGIYMQPLSRKETVVVMAGTLMEYYQQQGQDEKLMALTDLTLEYYPKDIKAMLHKSSAYYALAKRHFMGKYPTPNDIPFEERDYFIELKRNHDLWRGKAEALGWRKLDQASRTTYMEVVKRAKAVQ